MTVMSLLWPSVTLCCYGMVVAWIGFPVFGIGHAVWLSIIAVCMLLVLLYGPSIAVLSFGMPVSSFGCVVHEVWNSVYVPSSPWVCP